MRDIDTARLELVRASEAFLRASHHADDLHVVTDVVAVVRHTTDGETVHRTLLAASGFRSMPIDMACDLLEVGFQRAWDQRT